MNTNNPYESAMKQLTRAEEVLLKVAKSDKQKKEWQQKILSKQIK